MKKAGGTNSAFYEEERDIMARTNSPWLTKLDYAFQVSLSYQGYIHFYIFPLPLYTPLLIAQLPVY